MDVKPRIVVLTGADDNSIVSSLTTAERSGSLLFTPDDQPTLKEIELRYVAHILRTVGGNKTRAARILGIDRRSLYRRLTPYIKRKVA